MASRVSFARPRQVVMAESHAEPSKGSGVGGRGVVPLKGNNHPPNTIPPLPDKKQRKEEVSVEAILAQVALLNPADKKTVLAKLSLETQKTLADGSHRDVDMWSAAAYEALARALGAASGAVQGPAVVKRVLSASTAWAPVADFMEAAGFAKETPPVRQAIYRMLAAMAVERALGISRATKVPLSPKFLASVCANLAAIFDLEYPGYLAAGLAPMVAKRLALPQQS